jgi:hypothetical protein
MSNAIFNTDVKSGGTDISITRAEVRVFDKVIEVWHILQEEVFNVMIIKFNHAHPRLQDTPQVKEQIIKFLNHKFKMRVAFRSKEAFSKHFTQKTYEAVKRRIQANGNKSND